MSVYMPPSDEEKLDALFGSISKIDSILDDLHNSIWGYLPFCSDFTEQQKLDRLFMNSGGMDGFLNLDSALRNAKDVALRTVHEIGHSTPAEVAY